MHLSARACLLALLFACEPKPSEPESHAEPEVVHPYPRLWLSYDDKAKHATTSMRVSSEGSYEYAHKVRPPDRQTEETRCTGTLTAEGVNPWFARAQAIGLVAHSSARYFNYIEHDREVIHDGRSFFFMFEAALDANRMPADLEAFVTLRTEAAAWLLEARQLGAGAETCERRVIADPR